MSNEIGFKGNEHFRFIYHFMSLRQTLVAYFDFFFLCIDGFRWRIVLFLDQKHEENFRGKFL